MWHKRPFSLHRRHLRRHHHRLQPQCLPRRARLPSPFPFGMRTVTATYASSVSTNMSAYEDLLGHHLISIRNLIASTPDDSYPTFSSYIASILEIPSYLYIVCTCISKFPKQ